MATDAPQLDLRALRRQRKENALRLEVLRQTAQLREIAVSQINDKLESYHDPDNYVDVRDYLFDRSRYSQAARGYQTTINDRDDGRNLPIFQTEQELAAIRGVSRVLCEVSSHAIGALENLGNYIIGDTGYQFTAGSQRGASPALIAAVQEVVDTFLDDNDFCGDLDHELFRRSRRDGEYFLGLWHVGDGHVQARCIEPDAVTEPGPKRAIEDWLGCDAPSSWSFGVHADAGDVENRHGFYVQWTSNANDWDYLPGGQSPYIPPGSACWAEHAKVNTDRNVKRGLSDLFAVDGTLDLARKLLRSTGRGASLQAKIAWIKEVAQGVTKDQVAREQQQRADAKYYSRTAEGGTRSHYVQEYADGTVLTPSAGTQYKEPPMARSNGINFVGIVEALLRSAAVRWQMPEHMLTGSAANNNYASILEAGAPFTKSAKTKQQFYVRSFGRIIWKVLEFAFREGLFAGLFSGSWREFMRLIEVQITPPPVEVRDETQQTSRRAQLHQAGVISLKTWRSEEGFDHDQEEANFQEEPKPAERPDVAAEVRGVLESIRGAFEADVLENCGTGDGGFQPGNSCQADTGGVGGGQRKARRPVTHDGVGSMWDEVVGKPGHTNAHAEFGSPSKEEAEKLSTLSGWPISENHVFAIDGEDVRHTYEEHGEPHKDRLGRDRGERRSGQLPVTKEDAEKLPGVLTSYDNVSFDANDESGPALIFKKRVNGHLFAVVVHRGKRAELHVKAMRKYPSGQK